MLFPRRHIFQALLLFFITSLATTNSSSASITWKWPIQKSKNNRYLIDQNEKPFFALGDCLWKMHLYSPSDVELIFDDRSEKGFTVMCVATGCEGDLTNYAGAHAFLSDDLSTPNEKYWSHIDFIIKAAHDRNMAVMFNPIWIRNNRDIIRNSGVKGCHEYGKWIANRYRSYPNLMFFVGGDHPPRDEIEEMNSMALGLKKSMPDALITYHADHQHPSKDFFPESPWLDINWTYAYTPEHIGVNFPYNQGFEEWQDHPDTPIWFGEGYYDWGGIGLKGNDVGRYMMRRQLYWAILSSIAGYNYGAEGLQDKQNNYYNNSMTWQETLDYPSSYDCLRMLNLIDQFDWWTWEPDFHNQTLVGGYGHYMGEMGDDYALAARTRDGSFAIVYTPVTHDLEIDMRQFKTDVTARWFNPTNATYKKIGSFTNTGSQIFRSPGDNGTGSSDWILILQVE